MYIAVCDDQSEVLEAVSDLLRLWQENHQTPMRWKTFRCATELLNAAEKEHFTLYLLDVMMPGMNGLAAAREIRSFDAAADIVFLSTSSGFAYESYGVHALDYMLKPVRSEILFPVLDRISLREQKPEEGLTLKCGMTLVRVPFSELAYVEVISKHLYFNLTDGEQFETTGSLHDYEDLLLMRPEFMRVGRSYIVNILQIRKLSPAGIITFSGENIPIPRRLYPQLQKDYMKLLFTRRKE